MALEFLPNLPKADLDDRGYSDLLQECLLRIPRYCPEWTNYNPSEPGVTLLESFAWLTDQMLMRFNDIAPLFEMFYKRNVLRVGFAGANENQFFTFSDNGTYSKK